MESQIAVLSTVVTQANCLRDRYELIEENFDPMIADLEVFPRPSDAISKESCNQVERNIVNTEILLQEERSSGRRALAQCVDDSITSASQSRTLVRSIYCRYLELTSSMTTQVKLMATNGTLCSYTNHHDSGTDFSNIDSVSDSHQHSVILPENFSLKAHLQNATHSSKCRCSRKSTMKKFEYSDRVGAADSEYICLCRKSASRSRSPIKLTISAWDSSQYKLTLVVSLRAKVLLKFFFTALVENAKFLKSRRNSVTKCYKIRLHITIRRCFLLILFEALSTRHISLRADQTATLLIRMKYLLPVFKQWEHRRLTKHLQAKSEILLIRRRLRFGLAALVSNRLYRLREAQRIYLMRINSEHWAIRRAFANWLLRLALRKSTEISVADQLLSSVNLKIVDLNSRSPAIIPLYDKTSMNSADKIGYCHVRTAEEGSNSADRILSGQSENIEGTWSDEIPTNDINRELTSVVKAESAARKPHSNHSISSGSLELSAPSPHDREQHVQSCYDFDDFVGVECDDLTINTETRMNESRQGVGGQTLSNVTYDDDAAGNCVDDISYTDTGRGICHSHTGTNDDAHGSRRYRGNKKGDGVNKADENKPDPYIPAHAGTSSIVPVMSEHLETVLSTRVEEIAGYYRMVRERSTIPTSTSTPVLATANMRRAEGNVDRKRVAFLADNRCNEVMEIRHDTSLSQPIPTGEERFSANATLQSSLSLKGRHSRHSHEDEIMSESGRYLVSNSSLHGDLAIRSPVSSHNAAIVSIDLMTRDNNNKVAELHRPTDSKRSPSPPSSPLSSPLSSPPHLNEMVKRDTESFYTVSAAPSALLLPLQSTDKFSKLADKISQFADKFTLSDGTNLEKLEYEEVLIAYDRAVKKSRYSTSSGDEHDDVSPHSHPYVDTSVSATDVADELCRYQMHTTIPVRQTRLQSMTLNFPQSVYNSSADSVISTQRVHTSRDAFPLNVDLNTLDCRNSDVLHLNPISRSEDYSLRQTKIKKSYLAAKNNNAPSSSTITEIPVTTRIPYKLSRISRICDGDLEDDIDKNEFSVAPRSLPSHDQNVNGYEENEGHEEYDCYRKYDRHDDYDGEYDKKDCRTKTAPSKVETEQDTNTPPISPHIGAVPPTIPSNHNKTQVHAWNRVQDPIHGPRVVGIQRDLQSTSNVGFLNFQESVPTAFTSKKEEVRMRERINEGDREGESEIVVERGSGRLRREDREVEEGSGGETQSESEMERRVEKEEESDQIEQRAEEEGEGGDDEEGREEVCSIFPSEGLMTSSMPTRNKAASLTTSTYCRRADRIEMTERSDEGDCHREQNDGDRCVSRYDELAVLSRIEQRQLERQEERRQQRVQQQLCNATIETAATDASHHLIDLEEGTEDAARSLPNPFSKESSHTLSDVPRIVPTDYTVLAGHTVTHSELLRSEMKDEFDTSRKTDSVDLEVQDPLVSEEICDGVDGRLLQRAITLCSALHSSTSLPLIDDEALPSTAHHTALKLPYSDNYHILRPRNVPKNILQNISRSIPSTSTEPTAEETDGFLEASILIRRCARYFRKLQSLVRISRAYRMVRRRHRYDLTVKRKCRASSASTSLHRCPFIFGK